MKKLYPFLAGITFLALGGLSGGSIAQDRIAPQPAPQTIAQTPSPAPACALPESVAVTFLGSKCEAVVLTQPTTFYRYYSTDSNRFGRYLTIERYERNVDAIRKLALKQEWGNQATMRLTVTVPAGTKVFKGVVAPQEPASCYAGGGQQTFIENTRDPNLVWSPGTPMQVETFQCP